MFNIYLRTNKNAIRNRGLITILVVSIFAVVFILAWFNTPSKTELPIEFYFAYPLIVTTIILEDNYLRFKEFKSVHKRFNSKPFSQLYEIGFNKLEINQDHWWKMCELQFKSEIGGYKITALARAHFKREIDFNIPLTLNSQKKHNWIKLYKHCHNNGISIYRRGANIVLDVDKSESMSTNELYAYLNAKTNFLKELRLDPQ